MAELKDVSNQITYGLYGTFYEGSLFDNFLLGNHGDNEGGNLHFMGPKSFHKELNEKTFHSARWVGQIKIPDDDTYLFSTSDPKMSVCIRLENTEDKKHFDVLQGERRYSAVLKKGIYNIRIEYLPIYPILDNQNVLQVSWKSKKIKKEEVIPKENFLLPNYQIIGNPTYIQDTLFEGTLLPKTSIPDTSSQTSEAFFAAITATESFDSLNEEPLVAESEDDFTSDTVEVKEIETDEAFIARIDKERADKLNYAKRQEKIWQFAFADLQNPDLKPDDWVKKYEPHADPDYDVKNPFAKHADANGDGLTNFDSTNGFYVGIGKNPEKKGSNNEPIGMLTHLPWTPESGEPKYTCSFTKPSTAGDPYTDLQKALGSVMNVLPVTKHPLIAACPFVSAQMEGYSIVPIEHTTVGTEKGLHATTGNRLTITNAKDVSTSAEHSQGTSVNLGGSASGPTGGIGINTSQSLSGTEGSSNSHSIDTTSDVTTTKVETLQKQFNTAERATFGAYIRYVNTGTASLLKGVPTLNFVDQDNTPWMTVRPPNDSAFEALNLEGDSLYPSEEKGPLFLQTADAFGSVKMSINSGFLDKYLAGKGSIRLQVPQTEGYFRAHPNAANEQSIPNSNELEHWYEHYPHIRNNTAHITLITPDGKIYDRHIAAPKKTEIEKIEVNKKNKKTTTAKYDLDYYHHPVHPETPLLTIGEAIQIAFGQDHKNFTFENDGIEYDLKNVSASVNQETANLLTGQKSEMVKVKGPNIDVYDYHLYQGMRIVVEVNPTVTLSLQYTPKDPHGFDKYILLHNETDKTLHYTVSVSATLNLLNKGKELFETGVLEPHAKEPKKIPFDTITDQDILKIYTGEEEDRQKQKLVWNKHVAKIPGFVQAKPRIQDVKNVANGFQFLNWIGDFTGQSKCRGVELFVHPKENWNNIASFALQIEKAETKGTVQYSPIARTQLTPIEHTKDANDGYKVSIDFSMFKDLQTTSINFEDTFTLIGTIDEEPEYTWEELKDCSNDTPQHCHFDQLKKPNKDLRTCEILSKKVFNPSFSIQDYSDAFKHLTFNTVHDVKSSINGDKITFPTVYKTLSGKIEDPLILGTIKKYKIKLNGSDTEKHMKIEGGIDWLVQAFAKLLSHGTDLTNYHLGFGNIEFYFHTDTMITKKETVQNERPWYATINLAWRIGEWTHIVPEGVYGSHTEEHQYNASVDGLLPGNTVEIIAVVDKKALPPTEQITADSSSDVVEISIFKQNL